MAEPTEAKAPRIGRGSSSTSSRSPTAATASRAATATSSSSPAPCPGTGSAPGSPRASATTPRPAVELLRPSPDRVPDRWTTAASPAPAPPGRGSPTSSSSATSSEQVDDALRAARRTRGLRARADRAGGGAVALPQQARVLLRRARRRGGARLPRPRPLGQGRRRQDCLLASERDDAAATRSAPGAASGFAYDRRAGTGVLATWSSARAGARPASDPPRHLAGRDPAASGGLHTIVGTRRAAPTGAQARSARSTGGGALWLRFRSRTARSSRPTPRWPSGSTGSRRDGGPERRERVYRPLLRHRHPRPNSRAAPARSGASRSSGGVADAEHNASSTGSTTRRFRRRRRPHRDPAARERAGSPDLVVVDPPRAGLSKKVVGRLIECEAPRIVYVSCDPTTLAPNAASSGRPAIGCAG